MKTPSGKGTILAVCAALLFVGVGCSEGDLGVIFDFVNDWAKSHDIVDDKGNPTATAVARVASGGFVSSGDDTCDAAIDAGQVVKSVQDADVQLARADDALDAVPPRTADAQGDAQVALNLRPNDWHVRSKYGLVLVETGDSTEGRQYLQTYSSGCLAPTSPVDRQRCIQRVGAEADRLASRGYGYGGNFNCGALGVQYDAYLRLSRLASSGGDDAASAKYDAEAKTVQETAKSCGGQ